MPLLVLHLGAHRGGPEAPGRQDLRAPLRPPHAVQHHQHGRQALLVLHDEPAHGLEATTHIAIALKYHRIYK